MTGMEFVVTFKNLKSDAGKLGCVGDTKPRGMTDVVRCTRTRKIKMPSYFTVLISVRGMTNDIEEPRNYRNGDKAEIAIPNG